MKSGWLYRDGHNERWLIVYSVKPEIDYVTLTSGSIFEIYLGGKWIKTRMEHNGDDYYPITSGIKLENNLKARLPRRAV